MRHNLLLALSCSALLMAGAGLALAEPLTVGGKVLDQEGRPLAKATVDLLPVPTRYEQGVGLLQGKADPDPAATAVSDATGLFRLTAPGQGLWRIRVQAPGFVPQEYPHLPLLEAAELPEVRLEPGSRVKVQVADAEGRPLAGVRVLGSSAVNRPRSSRRGFAAFNPWQAAGRAAVAGPDGTASLLKGAEETLTLQALAPGHAAGKAQASGPAASVQIRLPRGCGVTVEVAERERQPAAGALIEVDGSMVGTTDAAGRLAVTTPCGQETWIRAGLRDGRQSRTTLSARRVQGEPVRLTLPPQPLRLTGRALEEGTRRPLAGALVWSGTEPGREVWTDRNGAYTLTVQADAPLRLDASALGHLPDSVEHRPAAASGNQEGPSFALAPLAVAAGLVVDGAGRPVSGADVTATLAGGDVFSPSSRNRTRSGAQGTFRLHLDPGKPYDVEVRHPGFAPARVSLPETAPTAPTAPDTVRPALRVVLQKGQRAAGTVLDSREQPVAGARILLLPSDDPGLLMRLILNESGAGFTATSGADGRFSFDHLPLGRFSLRAEAAGFGAVEVPGLEVRASASPVSLGTVILPPGVDLAGVVVDARDQPVAGAQVSLSGEAFSILRLRSRTDEATITDAAGRFLFSGLGAEERRTVSVTREGYAARSVSGIELPLTRPLRIVLAPGARIAGRVVDERGHAVTGAAVQVRGTGSGSGSGAGRALTDESGRFEIRDLETGTLTLRVDAEGLRPTEIANLELAAGKDLDGLEVVLRAGAVVTGQVLGPDGKPVSGARVGWVGGHSESFHGQASSDADGKYRLEGVETGQRVVAATHSDYQRAARELDVQPGENRLDLRLDGGHAVSGRVVDAAGQPVEGAHVSLRSADWARAVPDTRSGAEGAFRFPNVGAGTYDLIAGREGHASGRLSDIRIAGPVDGLEVRLERSGVIRGKILGVELPQLSQVNVRAEPIGGRIGGRSARPDFRGEYRIEGLSAGEWQVYAFAEGRRAEGKAILEAGGEAVLDLELGRSGLTLSGRVLRRGEPVDGVRVQAQGTGTRAGGSAQSNQDGAFRISGLEPGTYQVRALDFRRGISPSQTVELTADQEVVIELPESRVSGRVVDAADSSPIEGAIVSLEAVEPVQEPDRFFGDRTARSDTTGAFTLGDVEPGSFRLVARKEGYGPGESLVQIEVGGSVDGLRISLNPTQGLTLQVASSTSPPQSVQVALLDAAGRAVLTRSHAVAEGGRVRLSEVPPGRWSLLVAAGDTATAAVEVVAPGPAVPVTLPPPLPLHVAVPALVDSSLPATLTLQGANGRPYQAFDWFGSLVRQWPMEDGKARLTLPPGDWKLTVTASDGRSWQGTAVLRPGAPGEITLR